MGKNSSFFCCLSLWVQPDAFFIAFISNEKTVSESYLDKKTDCFLIDSIKNLWSFVNFNPITKIIVPKGPDTFTSIRVLLSTVKGLSLAFPKAEIFAPTHFEVLGYVGRLYTSEDLLILIDSKRGDFYGQYLYKDGNKVQKIYTKELIEEAVQEQNVKLITNNSPLLDRFTDHLINYDDNLALRQTELPFIPISNLEPYYWEEEIGYRKQKHTFNDAKKILKQTPIKFATGY
ncbi:MAG: hypothetical protein ACTSXG_03715 [Alphaproteobacteria bacterium]